MSMHHCDDCRFLHSQCKCPDISPTWYPSKTHEENLRLVNDGTDGYDNIKENQ
jgi:hypothetical protein